MKIQHPEINILFNSLKQTIRNYISNQRPSEPEILNKSIGITNYFSIYLAKDYMYPTMTNTGL